MSGELVLIIDDSREIAKHLAEYLLPNMGYEAITAFTGRQGLKKLRDRTPDLVMLDLNLPEMTGLDVLQAMAKEGIDTPVILMTGYGSEKSAIEAFRLGIKDYLVKPFTLDEVSDTVERAMLELRMRQDKEQLTERLGRTEGEMRRQVQEMRTLFAMGKELAPLLNREQVLNQALQSVLKLTSAERATIWLPGPNDEVLHAYTRSTWEQDGSIPDLPIHSSQVGEIYRTGTILRDAVFSGSGVKIDTDYLARAVLYVPLSLRGKIVGVLGVSNHEAPRAFSARDELLLSALADYIAIALGNARAYQSAGKALAQRTAAYNSLLRVTRTINSSLELNEVAQLTIKEVHDSWDIEASSVWLLDEQREHLQLLVSVGAPAEVLSQFQLRVGQGIVGHVAQTGEPLFSNNVDESPFHYDGVDEATGFETRSLLCVPLHSREQIIGVLQLINKQDGAFDEQDVERAVAVAAGVATAVTNARLFEEASSRQQMLTATMEHNGNPIIITDLQGRLLLLNQRARQILSVDEEAIGSPVVDVLSNDDLAALLAQPLAAGAPVQRQELVLDDERVWLCNLAPIPEYGRIVVLHDITYLKELDAVKSDFLATVSHDLRAPLNSIVGFATSLDQIGPLNARQEEFVQSIVDAARRMSNLVSALLDLARVDSQLEEVREPCDMQELVRSAVVDLQGRAIIDDIDLQLEAAPGLSSVSGNPNQIRQAVVNLVDNAIKYSPPASRVQVTLGQEDGELFVAVRDWGAGIADDDAPRIFERFFRGQGSAGREGTGLGLALVRSIAEAHGGRIEVESQTGQGSTFTLWLPAGEAHRQPPDDTPAPAKPVPVVPDLEGG
ncbi:MAG: GAF domain-containing protein [Candidatus Promineifilaceae bacterium]|nr:GAF domain-containing protein [Candidatus Promineifilaceae bacterium]